MILTRTTTLRLALCAVLVSATMGASALAGPVVSEPFGYAAGDIAGQSGGGELGWNGSWAVEITAGLTGTATVEAGSLPFSTYATAGNRLQLSATASTDFNSSKYVRPYRTISTGVSSTGGELWQSFLYRRIDNSFNGDTDGIQDVIRNNTGGSHFRVRPKRQNIDGVQLRYDSHSLGQTKEAPAVNDGDVFLFVMRFEHQGETVDGPDTGINRPAQMWMLSESGYDAVLAGTSDMDTETVVSVTALDGTNGPNTMNANDDVRILHLYRDLTAYNGDAFTTEWDELRWGDSIDDVVPGFSTVSIPEPGTFVLAGLACLALIGSRRRLK